MIICDYYYRDAQSGKSILSGTFSSINASSFPTKHGNCAVYLAVTDIAQKGSLQLVFRKIEGDFSMKLPAWEIACPQDRRTVVEIGGNINGLPIPQPGDYEFSVMWEGNEIFSRRLMAQKVTPAQNPPPDQP
jgi:hypothetical protein